MLNDSYDKDALDRFARRERERQAERAAGEDAVREATKDCGPGEPIMIDLSGIRRQAKQAYRAARERATKTP